MMVILCGGRMVMRTFGISIPGFCRSQREQGRSAVRHVQWARQDVGADTQTRTDPGQYIPAFQGFTLSSFV